MLSAGHNINLLRVYTTVSGYSIVSTVRQINTRKCQPQRRQYSGTSVEPAKPQKTEDEDHNVPNSSSKAASGDTSGSSSEDAMTQRLEQLTEDALQYGRRTSQIAINEAGFDEELRKRLEEKIASASIRADFPSAFAQSEMPSSAGKGTKDVAAGRPWTGTEAIEDTALRMLTDAHKPLPKRPLSGSPKGVALPTVPVTRKPSSGTRLANARDRSTVYSSMKETGMSKEERDQLLKEMKARFTPAANNLPATIAGLASLANERIEDAIARGQFKNLPRGKALEVDHNANSPFIDTTEYLMNKIIKKQDIVPPWIEKQQELAAAARRFRTRLRVDWRRHAARVIASLGGSLDDQVRRAEQYAIAERSAYASKISINTSDKLGDRMSGISASGQLITNTRHTTPTAYPEEGKDQTAQTTEPSEREEKKQESDLPPFRDPNWESAERNFHKLSVESLNSLTRTYNLIAPQLAQKPYFNLDRELKACYADVAPSLAEEILQRAQSPKAKYATGRRMSGPKLFQTADRPATRVHDEDSSKGYGVREFWRDLWSK
jgi:DnaJ-like protein